MAVRKEKTPEYLHAPVAEALEHLLEKHGYITKWSRVSNNQIFRDLNKDLDYTPEQMRKMVKGERTVQPEFLEVLAERLGEDPRVFREYRRWELDQVLDRDPDFADATWDIAQAEKRLGAENAQLKSSRRRLPRPAPTTELPEP